MRLVDAMDGKAILRFLTDRREERRKWYIYSGTTLLVLAIALFADRQPPSESFERTIISLHHERGETTGTPVKWLQDQITLQTAEGRYETFRRDEVTEATVFWSKRIDVADSRRLKGRPHRRERQDSSDTSYDVSPDRAVQVVSWRFTHSGDETIERIEGCSSILLTRQDSRNEIDLFCELQNKVVELRVPEAAFSFYEWSLRDCTRGLFLSFYLRSDDPLLEHRINGDVLEIILARPHIVERPTRRLGHLDEMNESELELMESKYREMKEQAKIGFDDPEDQLAFVQTCVDTGFDAERLDEARFWLNNLLERFPGNSEYRYWDGIVLLKEGSISNAIDILESVIPDVGYSIPEVYIYLAMAYSSRDMIDKKCELLGTYLARASESKFAIEVESIVAQECRGGQ